MYIELCTVLGDQGSLLYYPNSTFDCPLHSRSDCSLDIRYSRKTEQVMGSGGVQTSCLHVLLLFLRGLIAAQSASPPTKRTQGLAHSLTEHWPHRRQRQSLQGTLSVPQECLMPAPVPPKQFDNLAVRMQSVTVGVSENYERTSTDNPT